MKEELDEILKHALTPTQEPNEQLNQKILLQAKERTSMIKKKKMVPVAILAISLTLIIGSATVFAALKYLSPSQVAKHNNDNKLADAFDSEDAVLVNETQEFDQYKITLLGAVSGKNISEFLAEDSSGNLKEDMFYATVAIERMDGTPMPDTSSDDYGQDPFYVSPYIKGLDPKFYSIMSMGGGYSEFVENGIQYRLLEMKNIEMFADRGIYIGVCSGTFYDNNAYLFDEATGEISQNQNYDGVNALFHLPLDPQKADPKKAEQFLKDLEESWNTPDEPESESVSEAERWMESITAENINEYAEPIESTIKTCTPDAAGEFTYSYDLPDMSSGSGIDKVSNLFPDGKPGTTCIGGYSVSDTIDSIYIEVFTLNEDQTVTFTLYKPKEGSY